MPAQFSVFEHGTLREGQADIHGQPFQAEHRLALERAHRSTDFPYFRLIRGGIQFAEYVGVFQAGRVRVEVLPKADRDNDAASWRNCLVAMLHLSGGMDVKAPSTGALGVIRGSILDLYFSLFLGELEVLLRRGLLKRYRPREANAHALRGALLLSKHLQHNHTRPDRLYVRHTHYTHEHDLHAVLLQALRLIARLNTAPALQRQIATLQLDFPEQRTFHPDADWFARFRHDRKSEPYRTALDIARILLLGYHPAMHGGRDDTLALMIDMNVLWEKFVYSALRRHLAGPGITVREKIATPFWREANQGRASSLYPDIVVTHGARRIVLDTKWKLPGTAPSIQDLRQMYAYHRFHGADDTALVYPGAAEQYRSGLFLDGSNARCGVLTIAADPDTDRWQGQIALAVRRHLLAQAGTG